MALDSAHHKKIVGGCVNVIEYKTPNGYFFTIYKHTFYGSRLVKLYKQLQNQKIKHCNFLIKKTF